MSVFHPQVWEVFSSIASSNFSDPSLSLSLLLLGRLCGMFICLMLCQKLLIIILFKCCLLFKILSFFLFRLGDFHYFVFQLPDLFLGIFYLLLMPSNVFCFSCYIRQLCLVLLFSLVKLFTVFRHSSVFIEHLYDCYLELHIK